MDKMKKQVWYKVRDQVRDQIYYSDQVWNQFCDQIENSYWDQVLYNVGNQVRQHVREQSQLN